MSAVIDTIETIGRQGGVLLQWGVVLVLVIHSLWCLGRKPSTVCEPASDRNRSKWTTGLHVLLVSLVVVVLRIPTWELGEANVDESQWIAGALTLADRFALWGTVDPTTNGPVSILWLYGWNALMGEFSYHSAKVFTTLHALAITGLFWVSLRTFLRPAIAMMLSSAFAIVMGGLRLNDFVGYNGEQPSTLLFAVSVAILLRLQYSHQKPGRWSIPWVGMLGLCLGLIPYVKLQSVPMGMVIGLYALWVLRHDRRWIVLLGSVGSLQIAIFAMLFWKGWLDDFYIAYLKENLSYAASHTKIVFWKRFAIFPIAWWRIIDGRVFGLTGLLLGVTGGVVLLKRHSVKILFSSSAGTPMLLSLVYLVATFYAITQPGTFFNHYFFWLFHPAALVMACLCGDFSIGDRGLPESTKESNKDASSPQHVKPHYATMGALVVMAASLAGWVINQNSVALRHQNEQTKRPVSALGKHLGSLADAETKLAIWGWRPALYVETQLPQAASESVSFRPIESVNKEYFLNRYVDQLKQHEQVLFVDLCGAGGSYWFGEEEDRHENFSPLSLWIQQEFEQLESYEGARIYRTR